VRRALAMRLRRVVVGVMDDGLWSWEEMREQARNLTEELRFAARTVGRCHELAERPAQGEIWPFEVEKVTAEYVACDLMVRLYFISI